MPKWTDPLNHLTYGDDTIIFVSAHPNSLKKIMAVLGGYEKILGQFINKAKISYHMHSNVATALVQTVGDITGFTKGAFPFIYLGCPIFYTMGRKYYYDDFIKKCLLSILDPPKNILVYLNKLFARFFWSNKEEGRSKDWSSWQKLCLPKEEGGLGFRSLFDVSRALFAKLW
ncbi:uncharacterized protein [Nicotiana tomentosiformis]|uniref:uncharacterized protein n=1 Tax=Nicotiana tomentosiformis TaxID=4098 RepID=UPI00388C8C0A